MKLREGMGRRRGRKLLKFGGEADEDPNADLCLGHTTYRFE